ncbi:hypothetical protein BU24DRAFT_288783 [Aaosphaeria arxii CBS 175.79]|uniref:NADH-ubiquinone oxidoreductase 213 kDa subunit n=1 Tax=Aaosphaeria arxii CBS 175.79 TaxID=1450172 RepID=A0A6A5XFZ3_9PLEO|nr:uncharacterized protein BU24DRAFT_288783 [Aaosphaeria arxii CBS 175.79]KAF2011766.1 hypothetical protein BU24DRAFT_288783 [Aaosphaeria arxii CBS 175.79]
MEEHYTPRDTLAATSRTTLQTTAFGALVAGVQNALRKQNVGASGIITRSGGVIAVYAGVGFAYQFTRDSAANLRQKNDTYNEALAGFASGVVIGLSRRSIPFMLGAGASVATVMAAYGYTSGFGIGAGPANADDDDVDRREAMKKLRRRPLEETIAELGEGRGIYAPGYEERRRERLMAKYGVDVGPYQGQKS